MGLCYSKRFFIACDQSSLKRQRKTGKFHLVSLLTTLMKENNYRSTNLEYLVVSKLTNGSLRWHVLPYKDSTKGQIVLAILNIDMELFDGEEKEMSGV